MTKRTTGAAQVAPAPAIPEPKKRRGGPSGAAGTHRHRSRPLRASDSFFDLVDRAVEHNAESEKSNGGYSGFSDWARHQLVIAAADELGIDPLDALMLVKD